MIELCVSYSSELLALARDPVVDFECVEVGTWFEWGGIQRTMSLLPRKKFFYHYGRNLRGGESETRALIDVLQDRQRQTDCLWLSAHLNQHTNEEIRGLLFHGQRPPRYNADRSLEMLCRAVQVVQMHLPVPMLLENMPHWPLKEVDFAVMPDFIRRVLESTQCGLLVDIAHARVTAEALGCDVRSYLGELALDQAVEIHVSGPRCEDGKLIDRHEPLQEEDYAILEWLLGHTRPRIVTLEYWKDPGQLRDQLLRLKRLITQANEVHYRNIIEQNSTKKRDELLI